MEKQSLKLLPREERETNRDYAYRVLKRNILVMTLKPGEVLNENEIAELLGVSRTPVHEAVTRLKAEYLVDVFPQSGTRVSLISIRNVKDGVFFRNIVEQAIYRELTDRLTDGYAKKIEENLDRTAALIQKMQNELQTEQSGAINGFENYIDAFIGIDDEFHRLAYMAANRGLLWNSVKSVCSHFDRIRYAEFALRKSTIKHVHDDHLMIYEYILVGGLPDFDFEKFYSAHLTYYKNYFFAIYKENPQFFMEEGV